MTVNQFIERFNNDTAFRIAVVTDPIAVANTFNVVLNDEEFDAFHNIAWDIAASETDVPVIANVA